MSVFLLCLSELSSDGPTLKKQTSLSKEQIGLTQREEATFNACKSINVYPDVHSIFFYFISQGQRGALESQATRRRGEQSVDGSPELGHTPLGL